MPVSTFDNYTFGVTKVKYHIQVGVFERKFLLWNLIGGRVIQPPTQLIHFNPEWFCPETLLCVFHEMMHFDLDFFPSNRDLSFLASCGSEGTQCFNLCVRISSLASWTPLNNDSIFTSLFSKRLKQRNGILAFIQRSHLTNGTSGLDKNAHNFSQCNILKRNQT